MEISYLSNKDLSIENRIPQTIKEDAGFYALMQGLCNYINESTSVVYSIIDKIVSVINSEYSSDIDINYLKRLLNKCNISIDWILNDADNETLRQVYFIALQGFVLQRLSDGSANNFSELIHTLFSSSASSIDITDGGLSGGSSLMTYSASISGIALSSAQSYFANYIKPLITGVNGQFTFTTTGNAASMLFDNNQEISPINDVYNNFKLSCVFMIFDDINNEETTNYIPDKIAERTGVWALELK